MTRSVTVTVPSPDSAVMISLTTAGGADAPAVSPITETPDSQDNSMSEAPSIR